MNISVRLVIFILINCSLSIQAQDSSRTEMKPVFNQDKNIIKTNVPALFLRNYNIQYERILNKKVALAISYRNMPNGPLPLQNLILNSMDDSDQEAKDQVESMRLSNMSITPEIRFYLGKGYGKGFYIAPFYRYTEYKASNVTVLYDTEVAPGTISTGEMDLSGKMVSNTGGILIGAQWFLGKRIALDWWILGPHFGAGNGDLKGVSSRPLTALEQEDLRNELENLDIPMTTVTAYVNENGAYVKMDGPWAGVRAGISLGFKF